MSRVEKNENLHIKINRWMKSHERSHPTDNKIWKNERSFKWKGGGHGKDQNSYLIKHAVPLKELENTGKLFTCITKKATKRENIKFNTENSNFNLRDFHINTNTTNMSQKFNSCHLWAKSWPNWTLENKPVTLQP